MGIRILVVLVLALCLFMATAPLTAQDVVLARPFDVAPDDFLFKWDGVHDALIFYRDTKAASFPAARLFLGGEIPGHAVSPAQDFPGAVEISVWDAAATPAGGIALLTVVHYGGQNAKQMLLTYDAAGTLRKIWNLYPYHHHRLLVDRTGNVYAFGHREDQGEWPGEGDYNFLIKYSPSGEILWEALPWSSFRAQGLPDAATTNGQTGEHHMALSDRFLILYLATTQELVWLDPENGFVVRRGPGAPLLQQLSASAGAEKAQIRALAPVGDEIFVQLTLRGRAGITPAFGFGIASIADYGASCRWISQVQPRLATGPFLGQGKDKRFLFLKREPSGTLLLVRRNRVQ